MGAFIVGISQHNSPRRAIAAGAADLKWPALLRNDTQNENHWLKVTLDGRPPTHSNGIGSRIYVTTGEITQMRELHASTNYMAMEPGRIAHFGLGATMVIDRIRVEWVGGGVTVMENVEVDQNMEISGPPNIARDWTGYR